VTTGKTSAAVALAALALGVLVVLAFAVGRFPVAPGDFAAVAWAWVSGGASGVPDTVQTVVLNVRGPRILAAIVVGAALSAAGAAYQSLFRNPLVSPDILGVS
jgi:iron complex transport system permease protein